MSVSAARNTYDAKAKELLGNLQILAWILKCTVPEFSRASPEEIHPCIWNPQIGTLPVEPGRTNTYVEAGNSESAIDGEGYTCQRDHDTDRKERTASKSQKQTVCPA